MAPRRVVDSDAAEVRGYVVDFLGAESEIPDEDYFKERARRPNIVSVIEPGVGHCELKRYPDSVRVTSLLPEGKDITLLKPILGEALRFMFAERGVVARTRVWARFFGGKDARGRPDGGEAACKAWQPHWPGSVVTEPPPRGDKLWEISSTMGQVT